MQPHMENTHASGQFNQNGKSVFEMKWRLRALIKFVKMSMFILGTWGRLFVRSHQEFGVTASSESAQNQNPKPCPRKQWLPQNVDLFGNQTLG